MTSNAATPPKEAKPRATAASGRKLDFSATFRRRSNDRRSASMASAPSPSPSPPTPSLEERMWWGSPGCAEKAVPSIEQPKDPSEDADQFLARVYGEERASMERLSLDRASMAAPPLPPPTVAVRADAVQAEADYERSEVEIRILEDTRRAEVEIRILESTRRLPAALGPTPLLVLEDYEDDADESHLYWWQRGEQCSCANFYAEAVERADMHAGGFETEA
ncbi:hypothetical protein M885DRAFT_542620 [Pelagophyceae sp. CCMP2097]|nr:hypothetical protein M885DRAFT_542620 [Pelagophyceae sp. CCMP2097]|mmetsp:Transcript_11606/g.41022  ORF Transcript_11606/g.41022 Transcript_11606/m.41022 type:complete len:221 (+) Transcript_11606:97-759(+)